MFHVHKSGCSHDFGQAYWNTQVFDTFEALQISYAPLPERMIYHRSMTISNAHSLKEISTFCECTVVRLAVEVYLNHLAPTPWAGDFEYVAQI